MSIRTVRDTVRPNGVHVIEVEVISADDEHTAFEVYCDPCDEKLSQVDREAVAIADADAHHHCQHCKGVIEMRPVMSGDDTWCRLVPDENVFPHWCPKAPAGGHRP